MELAVEGVVADVEVELAVVVVVGVVVVVVDGVLCVVVEVLITELAGLIGQPRTSSLIAILSFHFVGKTLIHFADTGQSKMLLTGVF